VQQTPIAPSQRSRRTINPEFEQLVLRCLAKEPDQRPRDAADLLARLEQCTLQETWTAAMAAAWWQQPAAMATSETPAGSSASQATDSSWSPAATLLAGASPLAEPARRDRPA
jgi:hypothetical protein